MNHRTPKTIQQLELHNQKVAVWCVLYVNGVVGLHYFNSETVRGVDYYQML